MVENYEKKLRDWSGNSGCFKHRVLSDGSHWVVVALDGTGFTARNNELEVACRIVWIALSAAGLADTPPPQNPEDCEARALEAMEKDCRDVELMLYLTCPTCSERHRYPAARALDDAEAYEAEVNAFLARHKH